MKKIGILALVLFLLIQPAGFALSEASETGPKEVKELMFELSDLRSHNTVLPANYVHKLEYSPAEDAYYILATGRFQRVSCGPIQAQLVYSSAGNVIEMPRYPEYENRDRVRRQIAFDGEEAYSVERDNYTTFGIYQLSNNEPFLAHESISPSRRTDLLIQNGNVVSYIYHEYWGTHSGTPIFVCRLGVPIETKYEDAIRVWDTRFKHVSGYDLTDQGTQVVYGGVLSAENPWGEEIRIVHFNGTEAIQYNADKGEGVAGEFTLRLPEKPKEKIEDAGLELKRLIVSDEMVMVLYQMDALEKGFIQRYTLGGELLDSFEVDKTAVDMTENADGKIVYMRQAPKGESAVWQLIQVNWPEKKDEKASHSAGTPRSLVSEHHAGGKTIAGYDNHMFGLAKKQNQETGAMRYLVPLRTQDEEVFLRIPYGDAIGKSGNEIDEMAIMYLGKEIVLPMSVFECEGVFSEMACQADAQFEIQLKRDESGQTSVSIQLLTIEQVDEKTKIVHRRTIQ